MDGSRFDDLTRALARGRTRRGVLKGLAGGLAAGVAALAGRGGVAAQRLPNGAACTRATQCASLKCADGVCCDATCAGQCEACDLQGAVGTCVPLPAGTQQHGSRPACTGTAVCQASCDGVTRNHCTQYPGLDISCAPGTCEDGFGIVYGCGGDGTCHPFSESCGLHVCNSGGTACRDTCASDADCVGEAFCSNGACQDDRPLGEACTSDAQCQSGICADGVCCASACPGLCQACNVPGQLGFCTEIPDGGACAGGTCCDGECVNTQTNLDHCGACDNACRLVPTSGTCEGEPICQAGACTFSPLAEGTLCREAAGDCDVDERCDGISIACPPDEFADAATLCRSSAGDCDPAEFCTGAGPDCPPDEFADEGTICRSSAGDCDVVEFCTGTSATCPPDAFRPEGVLCRPTSCTDGVGTLAAACPGNGPTCPDQTVDCFPYTCDAAGIACRITCTDDTHCVGNHFCNAPSAVCCSEVCPDTVGCNGPGATCGCDLLIISSSAFDSTAAVIHDDNLNVSVNGIVIRSAGCCGGGSFDVSAGFGDTLRITVTDTVVGQYQVSPLYLHCPATGQFQVLDDIGVPVTPTTFVPNTFYDQTFTVQL